MKAVFCFVALMAFVALTNGEECATATVDDDCVHMTCDDDYEIECHLRTCTCTHVEATCNDVDDCDDLPCADARHHCVDNQCRCGYGLTDIDIGDIGDIIDEITG